MRLNPWVMSLVCLLAASVGVRGENIPAKAADTAQGLNRAAIQSAYSDGEFEALTAQLEAYRAAHSQCGRDDSILIAKYLGVIYTSNPTTREKGKFWFYRLVQTDPNAELSDLFVSDEIQTVFERVRREAITRRRYQGINDVELDRQVHGNASSSKDTVVVRDTLVLKDPSLPGAIIGLANSLETKAPEFAEQEKHNKLGWSFDVNVLAGMKFMDASAWDPVQNQMAFQGSFDFRRVNWPIHVSIDFMHSQSKDIRRANDVGDLNTYTSSTQELFFGVRKVWDLRLLSLRPFCGGGIGLLAVDFANDAWDAPFRQTGYGGWLVGGLYYELERHLNLGGQFWYSWADIDFIAGSANGGGTGFGLMAGFHY